MNAASAKVLVVDDDPSIRKVLRMGLATDGYHILEAPTGKAAAELLLQKPNLVILDLGLPDMDGMELLRQIKAQTQNVATLILSGRRDEAGRIQALDLGAHDYLTKPFRMDEVLVCVRAALRHSIQIEGENQIFQAGDLCVDLARESVKVHGREVRLSPKDYDVLRVLVQHPGRLLTPNFFLREIPDQAADAHSLRASILRLRGKIEDDPEVPHYIMTETGVGYRLRPPD